MRRREIWKDIKGYERLYKVSNYGRIKSLKRTIFIGHHKDVKKILPGKILKQRINRKYLSLGLFKHVQKTKFVHILVAKHFVKGYKRGLQVNHKKGNKLDNRAWMLEWVTDSQNKLHAYKLGLKKAPCTWQGKTGKLHPCSIPILAIDPSGKSKRFESQGEAARILKMSQGNINMVLNGIRKHSKNYKFKYA